MDKLLYINKPKGFTSFDVCNYIRKKLNFDKVGHTGTLDPNATGVMILLIDKAVKLNQFIVSESKEYKVKVKYGILTDSLDMDGTILKEETYNAPSKEEILEALAKYVCTYNQEIPLTSAKKVNGKKLVDYQREGKQVDKQYKEVTVYSNELINVYNDGFEFKSSVSSGTFIRMLVQDILKELNLIGVVEELERTRLGDVSIGMCNSLDEVINDNYTTYDIYDYLSKRYKTIQIDNYQDVLNGKPVKLDCEEDLVLLVNNKKCLAMYYKDNDVYRSKRGLF